jgi:hypothetical protein
MIFSFLPTRQLLTLSDGKMFLVSQGGSVDPHYRQCSKYFFFSLLTPDALSRGVVCGCIRAEYSVTVFIAVVFIKRVYARARYLGRDTTQRPLQGGFLFSHVVNPLPLC